MNPTDDQNQNPGMPMGDTPTPPAEPVPSMPVDPMPTPPPAAPMTPEVPMGEETPAEDPNAGGTGMPPAAV